MMKQVTKRLTALLLALSLCVTPALAAGEAAADDPSEGVVIVSAEDGTEDPAEETVLPEETEEPEDEPDPSETAESEASEPDEETEAETGAEAADEAAESEASEPDEETVLTESEADVQEDEDEVCGAYTQDTSQRLITLQCSSGTDIRSALQSALNQAASLATSSAPYTVKVPAGSYQVSSVLVLNSNLTLDLTGVTLTFSGSSGNLFVTGTTAQRNAATGYTGFVNITIQGGTLQGKKGCTNCLMRMAHGTNIVLDGVTFENCYGPHEVEVAGINGFTVRNCTFRNLYSSDSGGSEALQMDILASDQCFGSFVNDGTTMKNVTITGCTFSNCPRGVGIHNQLLGSYHSGLEIANNTFSNLSDTAIYLVAFRNCNIHDNTITNCGQGIYLSMMRNNAKRVYTSVDGEAYSGTVVSNAASTITNNTITTKISDTTRCSTPTGIYLFGQKFSSSVIGGNQSSSDDVIPAGTYAISGVTVSGNTITTGGYGVRMDLAKNCTVSANTMTYSADSSAASANYYGFFVRYSCSGSVISGNTVKSFPSYGMVFNAATAATVKSNTVSACGTAGIYVYNGSTVTTVSSNKISGSKGGGIYVRSSKATTISSNTVTATGGYGIYFNAGTGTTVKSNTLSNNKNYGIYLSSKSAVTTISSNKISGSKGGGIYVSSSKGTTLSSNTITTTGNYGIHLNSLTASSTVKSNTVSGYACPVRVNASTSYTVTISGNTLTGKTSNYCISVAKGKIAISGNTLSKGKAPVYTAKGVKGTISPNTVKSCTSSKYQIKGSTSYSVSTPAATSSFTAAKAASGKLTVTWKKVSSASGYAIQYSTSSDFSNSTTVKVTSGSTVKKTITGLSAGKKYYVRVRAYRTCNSVTLYGSYSAKKSATV